METDYVWKLKELQGADSGLGETHPLLSRILRARGFQTGEEADRFLYHNHWEDLTDPFDLPDMKKAARKILDAIEKKALIVVYGDYDADGITATALMMESLRSLGADARYYIPDRRSEGYGLNCEALRGIKDWGASLAVTVDCGVSAVKEARFAAELGLDLVVTDHHQPPAELPETAALVNPKLGSGQSGARDLAGVGVAFKLVQALTAELSSGNTGGGLTEGALRNCLDLVALGTVADSVPLLGENRILVKAGLKVISEGGRPGLRGLLKESRLLGQEISAAQISFALAPRLNACGRMSHAKTGVELMLCADEAQAEALAAGLNRENQLRQEVELAIFNEIIQDLDENPEVRGKDFLVLSSETWHSGVLGIVASKVAERFYKPALLIRMENGIGKGSGRSAAGLNLYEALRSAEDCLEGYGGHEAAVGVTVRADRLEELEERLNRYARLCTEPRDRVPVLLSDAEVSMEELDGRAMEQIGLMAPFGQGNPPPSLIARSLRLLECRTVGADQAHLKIRFAQKNRQMDAVAFQMGSRLEEIRGWALLNVLFTPELNHWNGRTAIQMNVRDVKAWNMPDDPWASGGGADAAGTPEEERMRRATPAETPGRRGETEYRETGGAGGPAEVRERRGEAGSWDTGGGSGGGAAPAEARPEHRGETGGRGADGAFAAPADGQAEARLRQADAAERREMIRGAILGDRDYHLKQQEALTALESGRNTLLVMGTGRGKTAVFQTMAAELAARGKISILIYPLRSLVNDQYQRMRRQFEALGIAVQAVNGSMDAPERNRFFQLYGQGKLDIVLTTPEFISFHRDRFTAAGERIGLLVADEAHHIRQGDRKGYQQLPEVWEKLGRPLVLAATATADDETAGQISQAFQIQEWVLEAHIRENLRLTDGRREKDKLAYLMKIAGRREKTVVYVNSRRQSTELAEALKGYLPFMEGEIGFYHGGLDSESRRGLENRFRDTELRVMVSTSAFGEGVDIPDIRHVILYHMCFSRAEFNQLSGRAGRNQEDAWIHLLFNKDDMALNRMILGQKAPDREILARFYLMLKTLGKNRKTVQATDAELAGKMRPEGGSVMEETVSACLAILEEMKLVRLEYAGNRRYIHIAPPPPSKLDLADSVRFAEGQGERENFEEFAEYIMNGSPEEILSGFNRPILPGQTR